MKEHRGAIYGFLAVWILLFHIGKHIGFSDIPVIGPLQQIGNCGVDVFLFLSGYGTWKSIDRCSTAADFYRKRLKRIAIPYLVFAVPFYIWSNFIEKPRATLLMSGLNCVLDITQINFFRTGMQTSWFVATIAVLYLLLPLFYRIEKRYPKLWQGVLFLFAVYAAELLLLRIRRLEHLSIAFTRVPVFVLGTLFAANEKRLPFTGKKWFRITALVFLVVFAVIVLIKSLSSNSEIVWNFYILLVPGILIALGFLFSRSAVLNSFFSRIGSVSLEVYVVHVFLIRILKHYGILGTSAASWYLVLPAAVAAVLGIYILCKKWRNHGKTISDPGRV